MMVVLHTGKMEQPFTSFLCRICSLLLFHPIQLCCGHRFCRSCIKDQDKVIKCAQCDTNTPGNEMFNDRGIENDMARLKVHCGNCSWIGLFKAYQNHLNGSHENSETNPMIWKPLAFTIRELLKKLENCQRNVRFARNITQQMEAFTTGYCIGIEEQTPAEKICKQKDDVYVSSNGTVSLKISDIQKKLTEPGSMFTSAPFDTSSNGYKMCIRLYFNGNGIGKSTHLSAYLIIMRGDFDAILPWPFNFQVTFGLYDLVHQKDHIIESFQPDRTSLSFQRPQHPMNIASGIPKLISLEELRRSDSPYISEGAIHMKVMVREQPIPPHIFHFSMIMDHFGIPIHLQEEMIKEVIEKTKKSSLTLHLTLSTRQLF